MEVKLQNNLQDLQHLAETFYGKPISVALIGFPGVSAPSVLSWNLLSVQSYNNFKDLVGRGADEKYDILCVSGLYNWFDDLGLVVERLKYGFYSFLYFNLYEGLGSYGSAQIERTMSRLGFHLYTADGTSYHRFRSAPGKRDVASKGDFLAVNSRLSDRFLGKENSQGLLLALVSRFGIRPQGVIHVGAHKGAEYDGYKELGIQRVVFVEANPKLAAELRQKFNDNESVTIVEGAASDREGKAVFKLTNFDQSSSLLDLKAHKDIYPGIVEVERIEVDTFRLDDAIENMEFDVRELNLLAMDIQGGEGLALKGATKLLEHIDAIQVEVNYQELYEGCPLIWELDEFLFLLGFDRVITATPFHPQWGDALYIKKPIITNSSIGSRGRFGNQIFQYMFLLYYSMETGYPFYTPSWMGEDIFNVQTNRLPEGAKLLHCDEHEFAMTPDGMPTLTERLGNVDFDGFFQYNMKFYQPFRKEITDHFSYSTKYLRISEEVRSWFDGFRKTIVGVYMRRGDYGYNCFFIAPSLWYTRWINEEFDLSDTVIYVASDDVDGVVKQFDGLSVIHAGMSPLSSSCSPDIFDFIALTQCDKLAISNSTFSFSAALFNERANVFMRPKLSASGLVPFVPWESVPLLFDEVAEDYGPEVRKKARESKFSRSVHKRIDRVRKIFRKVF